MTEREKKFNKIMKIRIIVAMKLIVNENNQKTANKIAKNETTTMKKFSVRKDIR